MTLAVRAELCRITLTNELSRMDMIKPIPIKVKNYKSILRTVGLVLVTIGLIDIGTMVYCIFNRLSYHSSFNIFAVIAGVFLIGGNLKAARLTAKFAAFFLAGFIAVLIGAPFILPFDFILTYLRLEPGSAFFIVIVSAAVFALLAWVYKELTSPSVFEAMDKAKIDYSSFWRKPASGFLFGSILSVALVIMISVLSHGATASQAKHFAAKQIGNNYNFFVTSLSVSTTNGSKHVRAVVTAYNKKEIKNIDVDWQE